MPQLVYLLFVTKVEPAEEEVKLVMQRILESIKNLDRDPASAYYNRIRALNFGTSYFYEVSKTVAKDACGWAYLFFRSCNANSSVFILISVELMSLLLVIGCFAFGSPG